MCDAILSGLRRFDAEAEELAARPAGSPPVPLDENHARLERRWRAYVEEQRHRGPGARIARSRLPRPLRWLWSPAFAYVLVLLLAYPAWRGLTQRPKVEFLPGNASGQVVQPALPAESTPVFQLPQTRGASAGLVRPGGSRFFVLSFWAPARPGHSYSAVIRDSAGRPLTAAIPLAPGDERGYFGVLCERAWFPGSGEFEVLVIESDGAGRAAQEFKVPFSLRR